VVKGNPSQRRICEEGIGEDSLLFQRNKTKVKKRKLTKNSTGSLYKSRSFGGDREKGGRKQGVLIMAAKNSETWRWQGGEGSKRRSKNGYYEGGGDIFL